MDDLAYQKSSNGSSVTPGWVFPVVAAGAVLGAFGLGLWLLGQGEHFGAVAESPDHVKVWVLPAHPEANLVELQKTLAGFGVKVLDETPYGGGGKILTLRGKVSPHRLNLIGDVCGFDIKYVVSAYAPSTETPA